MDRPFVSVVADIEPAFGVPCIFFGESSNVEVVLLLPWLLTVALVIAVGWAWWGALRGQGPSGSLWSRLHLAGLSILAVSVVWWLAYWNLLR